MAPGDGLALVACPPTAGTLAGRIGLHLDGAEVGSVTASLCASCRTATLAYVHVAAEYRCSGFGRSLVTAAVARAPSYQWTAPLPDGPVAQSLRARIAMRGLVSAASTPARWISRGEGQAREREGYATLEGEFILELYVAGHLADVSQH